LKQNVELIYKKETKRVSSFLEGRGIKGIYFEFYQYLKGGQPACMEYPSVKVYAPIRLVAGDYYEKLCPTYRCLISL